MKKSRRSFLATAGVGAAFTIVPRHVLGGPNHVPPSEIVNVALVGAGGRGLQNARQLMKLDDVRITAVADPAAHWDLSNFYYRGVAGREPAVAEINEHYRSDKAQFKCQEFEDFRELIEHHKDLDAILCATPDHMHATVSVRAMREKKHVYCEKPLTHNIREARLVSRVARETGVATQLGNQGHSTDTIRETVEWVRAGAIGKVREVHAWVGATRWNPSISGRPAKEQPIPKGLNWDLWLGPREPTPFHSVYAPVSWRDFWDYGLGAMGDFGCHDLDSAVWALNLSAPSSVEMHPAGQMSDEIIPFGELGYFYFDAQEDQQPVKVIWYSGGVRPDRPEELPAGRELGGRGVLFVGEKGKLLCGGAGGRPELLGTAEFASPAASIPRSNGHHRDWIDAIKGGPAASSNFEYGARLTEITLLGVAALRLGNRIEWDAANMQITSLANKPESAQADAILNGEYRPGWELS